MQEKELKQVLTGSYDFSKWHRVIDYVFPQCSFESSIVSIENNNDKISHIHQKGEITLTDNKRIIILEVAVKKGDITKAKVGFHNLTSKFIDQANNHGILAFYIPDDEVKSDYRLSFICKESRFKDDGTYEEFKTNPKRYTYVLGRNVTANTATKRLIELAAKKSGIGIFLHDVVDAFSVEALTKEFYNELSNWYFWALQNVKFPEDFEPDEEVRNATSTIRLITRLMFVWFLKQKGLIPNELFDKEELKEILNYSDKTGSTFYKAILQNLFFATLNTEMSDDKRKFVNRQYGIQGFYRYERFFSNKNRFLELTREIPFLNGGLFENLDKNVGEPNEVRIDCFSNKVTNENRLSVPDYLFFDGAEHADLNRAYGDSNHGNTKVRGLIEILKSYNFTIEENTPYEIEVALDPELLGKVFENLLASYNPETKTTARKQTGSFYTPREIVNYMVDESIVAYLKNKLLEEAAGVSVIGSSQTELFGNETRKGQLSLEQKINSSNWVGKETELEENLRLLLTYNREENPFDAKDTALLIKAINDCKILDPACGSGAFPMGMLQKMVHILQKLDKDNSLWRELQRQKAIAETEKAFNIGDKDERQKRLLDIDETFDYNASDYGRKLYLIENCIYGVDIQPIAVQIAKLRFFISLVCDQNEDKNRDNLGIRPLPNLETKFVASNTLIGLQSENIIKPLSVYDLEEQLKEVRHKYFTARTPETKRKYRQLDNELRKKISDELIKTGFPPGSADQISNWNPYDQNTHAEWYDGYWVFGISNGFDIIIGNPPYLRIQGVQEATPALIPYAKKNYVSAQKGNWDLYVLFTEAGYKMLKTNGILAFIQPHKFFQGDFGVGIRNFVAKEKCLYKIVHFGAEQMFESATNYTCLFFLQKKVRKTFRYIKVDKPDEWLQNTGSAPDYILPQPEKDQKWTFTCGEKQNILDKLQKQPQKLGDITRKIFQGIPTGADKVFVLQFKNLESDQVLKCYSAALDKDILIEISFVKPFLMGKDVRRYEKPGVINYVLFPYKLLNDKYVLLEEMDIRNQFPLAWQYLIENQESLVARENNRFEKTWWQYSRPQNLTEFESIKIMTPDIANQGKFTIDKGFNYHTTTIYSFSFKEVGVTEKAEYWLGVLNSKLLWFFLQSTGNVLRGGFFRFKTEYLKPFPVKRIDFKSTYEKFCYDRIVENVNTILDFKENGKDTFRFEAEIDALVFILYGFTEDEMMTTLLQMPDVSEAERREIQLNYKEYNRINIAP